MPEGRQRPLYHFTAPGDCRPFDPNGCLYWRGRFHVFYNFQDPDLPHGGQCWGHASSPDLIDWSIHPAALTPGENDPEVGIGCGCALVDKDGRPTLVYYGIGAGICIATAVDNHLVEWRKHGANPVISEPKRGEENFDVYGVTDPHAWLENDTYHVILGGRLKPFDVRDTAYLFTSDDLVDWRYERPFYFPHPYWTDENEDCACPDFFPVGDKHVLLCASHPRGARYYVGRVEAGTFIPEAHHRMTWPGGSCFAPESLLDGMGRRVMLAWVPEQRRQASGFSVLSLPRVLNLGERDRLRIAPAREIEMLRSNHRVRRELEIDNRTRTLFEMAGDTMELRLELSNVDARRVGLCVRSSPNRIEETRIIYDTNANTLSIDTTHGSSAADVFRRYPLSAASSSPRDVPIQTAPLNLGADEPLKLAVYLDQSIIEIYANDYLCMTQRVYPTLAGSRYTRIFADGGMARVPLIEAWDMGALRYLKT